MDSDIAGTSSPQGPRIYNQTASRVMRSYVIDEGELDMLAEHEVHKVVANSVASFLVAAALAFAIEWLLNSFTPWGALCITAATLAVPCFLWARRAHAKRGDIVTRIKEDSFMPDNDSEPSQTLSRGEDG